MDKTNKYGLPPRDHYIRQLEQVNDRLTLALLEYVTRHGLTRQARDAIRLGQPLNPDLQASDMARTLSRPDTCSAGLLSSIPATSKASR